MVRIVNGEVVGDGGTSGGGKSVGSSGCSAVRRSQSPLDKIAEMFWSVVSFVLLFFRSMFSPKGGSFKPARPEGRPQVRGFGPGGGGGGGGGRFNATPPGGMMGGG
mmetsp:Transcript_43611/g.120673  ORF Transcript_43611/g.120673 Transcript_43611/m.120673 type:complete len:106 (-) Transcript_43611:246-563(-)